MSKKVKCLLSTEAAKAQIEFLKHSGFPFMLKVSNYTTEIISDLYNTQFLQSFRSKQCFAAYSKIKSNINGVEPPTVDKSNLIYFQHDFKKDADIDEVINIDLKSAYATVLFNDGYITQGTSDYLGKLDKMDRLASVGMLAGKKHCFSYDENGKLIEYTKTVAATENFFFHCVKRVSEIMFDLQLLAEDKYLFTWVDGIYIKPCKDTLQEIERHLEVNNFPFTVEHLKNFQVRYTNQKIKIQFEKKDSIKVFQIPAVNNGFANDIINFLTNKL